MDILGQFTLASAVGNSDQFLIQAAGNVGNRAVKVTAETVRAYLMRGVHFPTDTVMVPVTNDEIDNLFNEWQ